MARIDLHVHTSRYSQCAETLTPEILGRAAVAAGLAGVVLTDHDTVWPADEIQRLQRSTPEMRFFRGIEVSCVDAHVVALAVPEAFSLPRGVSLREALVAIRAADGCSILAHPYRGIGPRETDAALADAVEIASTSILWSDSARCRDLARRIGRPCVASSDAHAASHVGWAATDFPQVPVDERELADWIREGLGIPWIAAEHSAGRAMP